MFTDDRSHVSLVGNELRFAHDLVERPDEFLLALGLVSEQWSLSPESVAEAREDFELASEALRPSQWWDAWRSVALSAKPSVAVNLLAETGWVALFPELADLRGVPQSAQWHPEGDVWNHTLEAMDAAARNAHRDRLSGDDTVLAVLATMCHDFGKVTHTQVHPDGRVTSHGHDAAGVAPAKRFLRSVGAPEEFVSQVGVLVATHMRHAMKNPSVKAAGKLVRVLEAGGATFEQWCRVADGDTGGRGSASETEATTVWRERHAEWLTSLVVAEKKEKVRPSPEQVELWKAESRARKAARRQAQTR